MEMVNKEMDRRPRGTTGIMYFAIKRRSHCMASEKNKKEQEEKGKEEERKEGKERKG